MSKGETEINFTILSKLLIQTVAEELELTVDGEKVISQNM